MNRLFQFASLVLLPSGLGLSSCVEQEAEPAPRPTTRQLPAATLASLQTDSVRLLPVRTELQLEGRVMPNADRTVPVYALVGGVIEKVPVALGDQVKQGQVLAVIRSTHMAELEQQRTESAVDLDVARRKLTTTQDLHADGMASGQELALARAALRKAQDEATRLRKQTAVYGSEGGHYFLRAPQAGIITEKHAAEGMQFEPGQLGSLFTLADLNEVWVLADVFQSDIDKVRTGLSVEISTLSYPDQTFTGRIDKVFNMLHADSKTMRVRVRLENPGHLLKPGMYSRARLTETGTTRLAAVPSASLVFANGRRYALVVKQNTLETRPVEVQHRGLGLSYVSSGLAPGELVATGNALLLYKALND